METAFWTFDGEGTYSHNNIALRFKDAQMDGKTRAGLLDFLPLQEWAAAESKAYPAAPVSVTVDGFSTFDGSTSLSQLKDVIVAVQTQTADHRPTGRSGVLVSRPSVLLLLAFDCATSETTMPQKAYLLSKAPRHGTPNAHMLGLPGGVQPLTAEKPLPQDIENILRAAGIQVAKPQPLVSVATIPAAVSEVATVYSSNATLSPKEYSRLSTAIESFNQTSDGLKKYALMSSQEADASIDKGGQDATLVAAVYKHRLKTIAAALYRERWSLFIKKSPQPGAFSVSACLRL